MNNLKQFLFSILVIIVSTFTIVAQSLDAIYLEDQITTEEHTYYDDGVLTQKLWFSYPDGAAEDDLPLIVLIHGGAFRPLPPPLTANDVMKGYRNFFAARNYKVIVPEYPLQPVYSEACSDVGWWRAIQGVNAAIKFAVGLKNSGLTKYQFDPDNVILFGSSAGAVTALTLTYTENIDLFNYLPGAFALYGGINAMCVSGTGSNSYSIKGTVSACGALPPVMYTSSYNFTSKNTALYFLHGINDGAVSEVKGKNQKCVALSYPTSYMYGPAYLLNDCSYHTLDGVACSGNPSGASYILPSGIYANRYYLATDNNWGLTPGHSHVSATDTTSWLSKFTNTVGTTRSYDIIDASSNVITVNAQSINHWIYKVATSPVASTNNKAGNPTGFWEEVVDKHVKLFPNPANSMISVQFPEIFDSRGTIEIYHISGQLLNTIQVPDLSMQNDIQMDPSWPEGQYVMKITTQDRVFHKKFIRNR